MNTEKLSGFLHRASSAVAILGSVLAVVGDAVAAAPVGTSAVGLGILIGSGVLSVLGFGAQGAGK